MPPTSHTKGRLKSAALFLIHLTANVLGVATADGQCVLASDTHVGDEGGGYSSWI